MTTSYGILTDYTTGEAIRTATRDEWLTSLRSGDTGAFDLDGRAVYVAGGYESEDDEAAERIATRNETVARWDQQAKLHLERIEDLDDDVELAMAGAAVDAIRKAAADELEPLGYRILHDHGIDTIVDERTPNGMLAIIARAERDRADAEHDAVKHAADRDDAIRQAIAAGVPVAQIAEAAGIKPARVYQIRDGRR